MGVRDPDEGQEEIPDDDDPFADIACTFKTGPPQLSILPQEN